MPKNTSKNKKEVTVYQEAPPILQSIVETLETNYMPYAMSVIVSRAIPEVDGFKPAHRKLLFTMYKMGLLTGARSKSADVVGTTMRLNPHGEQAIYETLVRLTRGNESLLHPFIDSKGNFGKVYSRDMAYAASRYTEVKLDNICNELFNDIDKNTVEFIDNYNNTQKEPTLLPVSFPNILVTPTTGIAVGMASSFCSFNLKEICKAAIKLIKNGDIEPLDEVSAPDFTTGGELLYDRAELEKIYNTGRGSFKLRAKYTFDSRNSCIEITEIPYTTTIESIIDKIYNLVKTNKIKDILDVRDETDLKGLKIAIDIRKNVDYEQVMQRLFAQTSLQDSFHCNFNFLIDGRPRVMGLVGILRAWLDFRKGCVARSLAYDLAQSKDKLHLLLGLSKILLDIDRAIAIIRNTESEKDVIPNLCKGFDIDEPQAEFIAEIRLRNLNRQYLLNRISEKDKLEQAITDLEETLKDDNKIFDIIANELKEIAKKFGKDRKTAIVHDKPINIAMQVEDYPIKLYLSNQNYFKKIAMTSLRNNPEIYLKDTDEMLQELVAKNVDDILFFSDRHLLYKLKADDMTDLKPSGLGQYLSNLLDLEADEKVIFMVATNDYTGQLIFCFDNGKIAKVPLASYATKLNRKKQLNAYSNKAGLVKMFFAHEDCDLFVVKNQGRGVQKALLLNTALLPMYQAKDSSGITAVRLGKGASIASIARVEGDNEALEAYRADKIPAAGLLMEGEDEYAT